MSIARDTAALQATAAQSSSDMPAFSRPVSSWLGKNTAPVKTLAPIEVKEDFARRLRESGYSCEGDCLRELVIAFTYGRQALLKVHADRIAAMSGIVPEAAE